MAEINLITTNRKYVDLAYCNQNFLNRVIRQKKESQHIDITEIKKKIRYTSTRLKALTMPEVTEWKEIHMIKLKQLASLFKSKHQDSSSFSRQSRYQEYSASMRQELHLIVEICKQIGIDYDSELVADIIQDFYFRQYKQQILQIMEQAGYNVNRYRDLHYQSSFFSLCCCWQVR